MTRTIGPYEVVRELGRGGMGVVFEARDATGRAVALKLILGAHAPDALARFGREAELLARVRHPHVVQVHTVSRAPEGPYLVTELVEGEPLSARARTLTPRDAAALVRALCDGVAAVHAQGIVHRDLKPDNVIVRPDGSPVLLDFGVARGVGAESLTQTGVVVGTPHFMAPEQAEGHGVVAVDARADVYGLGAILFRLLAGRRPFDEHGGVGVLRAVLVLEPRWPREDRPDVPAALEAICRRAMAKAPGDRYPSAEALGDALDAWLVAPPPRRRPAAVWGAAAVGGALALGAVAWWATRTPAVPPPPAGEVARPAPARPAPSATPAPPPTAPRPEVLEPLADEHVPPPRVVTLPFVGPEDVPTVAWTSGGLAVACNGRLALVGRAPEVEPTTFALGEGVDWRRPILAPSVDGGLLCSTAGVLFQVRATSRERPPAVPLEGPPSCSALASSARGVVVGSYAWGRLHVRLEGLPPRDMPFVGEVRDVAWSHDGDRVACATLGTTMEENRLCVFDTRGPWPWPVLLEEQVPYGFLSVAFATDGTLLAGDSLGRILLFDAAVRPSGTLATDDVEPRPIDIAGTRAALAHSSHVIDLAVPHGGGRWAVSVGGEITELQRARELRVWDLERRRERRCFDGLSPGASALALDPAGELLAVARPGGVDVYDATALRRPEPRE